MLARIVLESFRRRRRRKIAALAAIALGTGAATGLFMIFLGVGDAMSAEFRANRHNIVIEPAEEGKDLAEEDLPLIRDHFWKNNILGYAPFLTAEADVTGHSRAAVIGTWWDHETVNRHGIRFRTGLKSTSGAWKLEGAWADDGALVGERLAREWRLKPGDMLSIGERRLPVRGILSTGGEMDDQILVELQIAQAIARRPGRVDRVLVNAVTTPDSQIVEKFKKDPKTMTPQDYEFLNCTPFASTIAMELQKKFPDAEVHPIRGVTEAEAKLLRRVDSTLLVLALIAVVAAGLSVTSAMMAGVVDRAREVGLLKALGATHGAVGAIFVAEAILIGVAGSAIGYLAGLAFAKTVGVQLFGRAVAGSAGVYFAALGTAVVIALAGMVWPLRTVLKLQPTRVLHEA